MSFEIGAVVIALLCASLARAHMNVKHDGTVIKAGMHVFERLTFGALTAGNVHVAVPLDVMGQSSKLSRPRPRLLG